MTKSAESLPRAGFIGAHQIATEYPISVSTIWKQLKAQKFPQPIEVGRKRLWRREDVEAYFTPRRAAA